MNAMIGLVALGAIALTGCVQRAELRPLQPNQTLVAGDTARFGPGVTALDVAGRLVQLELRERTTVVFFKYTSMTGTTTLLGSRQLAPGVHRLPPLGVSRARAGRRSNVRERADAANTLWFHRPTDALLVVMTIPQDNNDPLRGMRWAPFITAGNQPLRALHDVPPSLLQHPDQPWAAYLVGI